MKRVSRFTGVALVLAVATLLCGFACSGSAIHKANLAAKQVADDLGAFESQIEQQYVVGNLSAAEAANLEKLCSQATLANDTFVGQIQSVSALNTSTSAQVATYFAQLVGQIELLNQQGVLQVKNPAAQAKLALYFQSVETGITVLSGVLQAFGQPVSAPVQGVVN